MKPLYSVAINQTLALLLFVILWSMGAYAQATPSSAPPASGTAAPSTQTVDPAQAGQHESKKDDAGDKAKEASSSIVAPSNQEENGYSKTGAEGVNDTRPKEHWNALKVPADFKFSDPFPPLRAEFPGFTREFVQITWRPGDVIDLYVFKPKGIKKPPVVLYLYSFPTDTDRFRSEEFGKAVTANGCAAVGFVSALTGQRFHDRPTKEWFISELQEALATSVHDVQLLMNYLERRGDMDVTRVGMFGEGSGGGIAIMTAAVDPRIRALDLFNPWGDWPEWLAHSGLIIDEEERKTFLKPEFLKKVEDLDPVEFLPKLKTPQVRLQLLESDTVTPKAAQDRMAGAAPSQAVVARYANPDKFFASGTNKDNFFHWVQSQLVGPIATQEAGAGVGNAVTTSPKAMDSNQ